MTKSACVRVCVRVRGSEGLVDEWQLRGAQSSVDVDRTESNASDVVLALGGRRAERSVDDALHAAVQGRRLPLARRHMYRPTHVHL